jgi:hypothetical protein
MTWLILLLGLAPVALAAWRTVLALKSGRRAWPWLALGVLCIPAYFLTTFLGFVLLDHGLYPFSRSSNLLPHIQWALFSLTGPWGLWLLGCHLLERARS